MHKGNKMLLLVSLSLIALSTVGFSLITPFFDDKISELQDKARELEEKQRWTFERIQEATVMQMRHSLLQNQYEVLTQLKADSTAIQRKKENALVVLRAATSEALNAAIHAEAISSEEGRRRSEEIDSVVDKDELTNRFIHFATQAGKGTRVLDDQLTIAKSKIRVFKKWKPRLHYSLVLVQAIGLCLGIFSAWKKN